MNPAYFIVRPSLRVSLRNGFHFYKVVLLCLLNLCFEGVC